MYQFAVRFTLLVYFIFVNESAFTQNDKRRLVLDKIGMEKRIEYEPGDQIILKQKGDKQEIKGIITQMYDSVLVLDAVFIKLNEIKYIKTEHTEGFLSPGNGIKMIIAGIGLLLIDQINHTLMRGEEFRIPQEITITSGSLIGFGIFWSTLRYRKFYPVGNRRIRIIE